MSFSNAKLRWRRTLSVLVLFAAAFLSSVEGVAQQSKNRRQEFEIWPKGKLPAGSTQLGADRIQELNSKTTKERICLVQSPTLTVFPADPKLANGSAVVICPGGGYNILAIEKEGFEIAQWLNSIGVTAFVLKYRVPRRTKNIHWEPMQDVQRSIRLIRQQAKRWNIHAAKIGVLGFSAGGHLAAMSGMQSETRCYEPVDEADRRDARPNFLVLIYAAYLGNDYRDDVAELGKLVQVDSKTPPTFMAVTLDDKMRGAQAALLLVELKKNKVPAELHVYSKGGHGYGIRPNRKHNASTWHLRLKDWLKHLPKSSSNKGLMR